MLVKLIGLTGMDVNDKFLNSHEFWMEMIKETKAYSCYVQDLKNKIFKNAIKGKQFLLQILYFISYIST